MKRELLSGCFQAHTVKIRPPQDVDVLVVLDFGNPSSRPKTDYKLGRPATKKIGTRASKIEDGEDVDNLWNPDEDKNDDQHNINH